MASLQIAIADDNAAAAQALRLVLESLGHVVICCAENGQELVSAVLAAERPDLIISDVVMPHLDGIAAVDAIWKTRPVPAVLVSAHDDPHLISRALSQYFPEYILKPFDAFELERCIAHALARFSQFQAIRKEVTDLTAALEDRKTVERAKGLLMDRQKISEEAAFRLLQSTSSREQVKLAKWAHLLWIAKHQLRI